VKPSGDTPPRNPITGIAGCCARAASGHVTAAPPSSVMNSRRFIRSPHRRERAAWPAHRRSALEMRSPRESPRYPRTRRIEMRGIVPAD